MYEELPKLEAEGLVVTVVGDASGNIYEITTTAAGTIRTTKKQTPFQREETDIRIAWEKYDPEFWMTSFRDYAAGWLAAKGKKFARGESDKML